MAPGEKEVPVAELTALLCVETRAELDNARLVASGLGTCEDLPDDVRELADLAPGDRVVAWTCYDPDHEGNLCTARFAGTSFGVGDLGYIPCFWLCFWPCYCLDLQKQLQQPRADTQVYWILGEKNLYQVRKRLDSCFVPGCCVVSRKSVAIPLEGIKPTIHRLPSVCCIESPEAIGVMWWIDECGNVFSSDAACLKNQKSFLKEIIKQRDEVASAQAVTGATAQITMGRGGEDQAPSSAPSTATAQITMDRGDLGWPRSIQERLQLITQLVSDGLVSQEDGDRKKQQILDSI
jgi:hypothetical protein